MSRFSSSLTVPPRRRIAPGALAGALCLLLAVVGRPTFAADESAPTIVVTRFFLQDDMRPGPGGRAPGAEGVARRTEALARQVREALEASDRYRVLELDYDSDAYQAFEESSGRVFECKSCVAELGKAVGSDLVAHGWVQRVSNLIINFNVEIIDSDTGKVYDRATVDTRGNTDKSWHDGGDYLLRHLNFEL